MITKRSIGTQKVHIIENDKQSDTKNNNTTRQSKIDQVFDK